MADAISETLSFHSALTTLSTDKTENLYNHETTVKVKKPVTLDLTIENTDCIPKIRFYFFLIFDHPYFFAKKLPIFIILSVQMKNPDYLVQVTQFHQSNLPVYWKQEFTLMTLKPPPSRNLFSFHQNHYLSQSSKTQKTNQENNSNRHFLQANHTTQKHQNHQKLLL